MRWYFISMFIFGGGAGIISLLICSLLRFDRKKKWYIVLFATYIGALISFTLLSGRMALDGSSINLIPFKGLFVNIQRGNWYFVLQMLVNIFMFVPMGAFLYLAKRKAGQACLIGFVLSLGIEIYEIITSRGVFDIDDLILNTLGTLIGFLLSKLILNPATAKRLAFAVLLYGLVVILCSVSLYKLNNYYRDEFERQSMIIWTPEKIMHYEGYDSEYSFSAYSKCTFIYVVNNDDSNKVKLDFESGKVKASGSGDFYNWFKGFYKSSDNWEELKAFNNETAAYKNVYKAGNYMIIFINKDDLIVVPGINNGTSISFTRVQD